VRGIPHPSLLRLLPDIRKNFLDEVLASDPPTLDHLHQDHDDGEDEKDVDESAHRVRGFQLIPMDDLLRAALAVKLLNMRRQLIALIVLIAIGLQGSVVAFAEISPLMTTDCQTAGIPHSAVCQDTCCPKGHHAVSGCLEGCVGTIAGAVTTTPQMLKWLGSATLLPQFLSIRFSSRGDSPLIRPPIL
jgi:hypothetical protein